MRNAIVWQRMLGLNSTVIEGVSFDETAEVVVVSVRPARGLSAGADSVVGDRRGMTVATVVDGGAVWIWARSESSSRPRRDG